MYHRYRRDFSLGKVRLTTAVIIRSPVHVLSLHKLLTLELVLLILYLLLLELEGPWVGSSDVVVAVVGVAARRHGTPAATATATTATAIVITTNLTGTRTLILTPTHILLLMNHKLLAIILGLGTYGPGRLEVHNITGRLWEVGNFNCRLVSYLPRNLKYDTYI
jgi:hypothetical protein